MKAFAPRNRPRRLPRLAALCLVALPLYPARAAPADPPPGLPKGSIVAFLPDPSAQEYSDLPSLKAWLRGQGWAICDGSEGTPDLNYRMLLGTVHPQEAGAHLGSRTHEHRYRGDTDTAYGREQAFLTGRGFVVRVPQDGHRHRIDGATEGAEHLPLSLRVLFIVKVR